MNRMIPLQKTEKLHFVKMQGLGNDYIYASVDAVPEDAAALSARLSDRHFGIGADGIIWILPSDAADCAMRIFNADGSEAAMCGNGIRCVGKYLYDRGMTDRTALTVETPAGVRTLRLCFSGREVVGAQVEMGVAQVEAPQEFSTDCGPILARPVGIGNPHAVVFCETPDDAQLQRIGAALQHCPERPDGVNVELVQVLGPERLRMRVWERGSGVTMACGTGACASAAAAVEAGLCRAETPIEVILDGGSLQIIVREDRSVVMEGPAVTVFEGEVTL